MFLFLTLFIFFLDECKVTVLTDKKNPNRETLIAWAKKSDLTFKIQDSYFLAHMETCDRYNTNFAKEIQSYSKSKNPILIELPNFNPEPFKHFLLYIYCSVIDWENMLYNTIAEVIQIGQHYDYKFIKNIGEEYLLTKIDYWTSVKLLNWGIDCDLPNLVEQASKYIVDDFENVSERSDFQNLKNNPKAVDALFRSFKVHLCELNDSFKVQKGNV